MSTRMVAFGVPAATSSQAITEACGDLIQILDSPPAELFVWIQAQEKCRTLRWFSFYGLAPRQFNLSPFAEFLSEMFPQLVVVLHNDRDGAFYFEGPTAEGGRLQLLSDGPFLAPVRPSAPPSVDFPQAGFSHAQLQGLNDAPEASLTPKELTAISAYQSAVAVGLRQCFPEEGGAYLSAYFGAERFQLRAAGKTLAAARRDTQESGANVLSDIPDLEYWQLAGIPPRFERPVLPPRGGPPTRGGPSGSGGPSGLGDPAVGAGSVKLLNALIQVGAVILVLGIFGLAPIIGLLTAPLVYFLTRKLLAASKASMEAMAEAQRR